MSLQVAEVFGKDHKHVLRDIEKIDIPEVFSTKPIFGLSDYADFAALNFGLGSYFDKQNQKRPMYELTKEFSLPNFRESNYLNKQGKPQPMIEMTRDGFTFLAMC